MKNPHDKSEYKQVDTLLPQTPDTEKDGSDADGDTKPENVDSGSNEKKQKPKFSGAYYYVDVDEQKLAQMSFARTALTVIAFFLQVIAAIAIPQAGYEYVTTHHPSYAYFYVLFTIFGMIGVSFWLFVMNIVRYKFIKRIPVERAPRGGFQKRAYFGAELYMAVPATMFVFELSFVCMKFDGAGLAAVFLCLAALGAAIAARQITHLTLKRSELIPAPEQTEEDRSENDPT